MYQNYPHFYDFGGYQNTSGHTNEVYPTTSYQNNMSYDERQINIPNLFPGIFGPPQGPPGGGPPGFGPQFGPPSGPPSGPPTGGPGGQEGPPSGPPPSFVPQQQQVSLFAVDPGSMRGCLFRYTYVWLNNRQQFWFYPIFLGRRSVAGWRWTGWRWVYFGIDLRQVQSFTCV